MARVWGLLPALLVLLAGTVAPPPGAGGQSAAPGFQLGLGENGTLQVMDDGRFSLANGAGELAFGCRWSVRLGSSVISPGTDAYRSALVAPLHRTGDTLTMLFYGNGMATEMAYRAAGSSAVLTVTTVNRWSAPVNVTFRCALGLADMEVGNSATGVLKNETQVPMDEYGTLSGYQNGIERFFCLLPEKTGSVNLLSSSRTALESDWDVAWNASRPLGTEMGLCIFWPETEIGPGEYSRVSVILSPGPAGPLAVRQHDLRLTGPWISPASAFERENRRLAFNVFNGGPESSFDAIVLFLLEGVPHSMMFHPLHPGWNETVLTEVRWAPVSAGNYTVLLVLPMYADLEPQDNLGTAAASVLVNPYRFIMKFSTSDVVSFYKSYPGARFKVQLFIYNTGFLADAYNISVRGVPDGWTVLLSNNNVSLEPDRIAYIWLTVQPSYTAQNGTYSFNIAGRSLHSGERQSLVETVEIGPPPPPGTGYTPPGYQTMYPGNGTYPPPTAIRPYSPPDPYSGGWASGADRTRLAYTGLSVIAVAIAVLILGVAVYSASRLHTITVLRRIIKRALYGLVSGDEYRMIIFDAYRRMCAHLGRLGFTREDHVTPREFARALKLALPLDIRSIKMLTRLFEEARYSNHRLGDPDRAAAIECLRHIDAELDRLTTFIEEEPRLARLKRRLGLGEA